LKIGIFTDSYKPYVSGVVTSIELFTKEFERQGCKVYIFAPNYPNSQDADQGQTIFRFQSIPTPTNPGFRLALPVSARLRNTIRKLGLDVIHIHSPFLLGASGARLGKRLGIPVVFTYHTLYEEYIHYFPGANNSVKHYLIRRTRNFCNNCSAVITPSSGLKKLLHQRGVRVEMRVIPTGIELSRFTLGSKEKFLQEWGIPKNHRILLYTGRLGKEKNLELLLQSYRILRQARKDLSLVIVGSGPYEQKLRDLISAGSDPGVILTGRLQNQALADAYQAADLFVFPSVTETQGLVLLEAMSVGLPVVSAISYGSQDVVVSGENGYLVEPEAGEIASAVARILDNPELYSTMTQNSRRTARQFSIERMAEKTLKLYEMLTNRPLERDYAG